MEDLNLQNIMCENACENVIFDLGLEADGLNLLKCTDDTKLEQLVASRKTKDSTSHMIVSSPGSSCGNALDGLPKLSFRLNSMGDDTYATAAEDGPELSIESVHELLGSSRCHMEDGSPRPKIMAQVSGTGLAPWEIHRPQKFVRDLILRRCFSGGGRVLDAGCGLGDNALYLAKAAPGVKVTAVDVMPRCLDFAATKAGLRNMQGKVELLVGDLLEADPACLPPQLGPEGSGRFSFILDSLTFHSFSDTDRERYVATLKRLLRPKGTIYMNCMSEEETRPGGPRRITVPELQSVFPRADGWNVESIEDSVIEFHPMFWGGKASSRVYTIHKLA